MNPIINIFPNHTFELSEVRNALLLVTSKSEFLYFVITVTLLFYFFCCFLSNLLIIRQNVATYLRELIRNVDSKDGKPIPFCYRYNFVADRFRQLRQAIKANELIENEFTEIIETEIRFLIASLNRIPNADVIQGLKISINNAFSDLITRCIFANSCLFICIIIYEIFRLNIYIYILIYN